MDVVKRLQNHNIKPSVQRIAIMNYLIEHRTHPTVDEIYTALSPSIPVSYTHLTLPTKLEV